MQTVHFKVHDPKMHCKGGTSRENTVVSSSSSRYNHNHGHGGHGHGGSMGRRGRGQYDEESGGAGQGRPEYGHGGRSHNHHPPMMMAQVCRYVHLCPFRPAIKSWNLSFLSKNIRIANLFLTFTSEEDLIGYSLIIKCLNAAADDERSPSNASAAAAADDPRPSD